MSDTVTNLTARLRNRLGVNSADPKFDADHCRDLLQEAADQVVEENNWTWLEETEAITADATDTDGVRDLPTDFLRTKTLIRDSGSVPGSVRVDMADIDVWDNGNRNPHTPYIHAQWNGELHMRPKPVTGETITHRYYKAETDVTTGSNTFLCPTRLEGLLIEYAAHLGFAERGNIKEADNALMRYERKLSRAIKADRRDTGPMRVRERGWR